MGRKSKGKDKPKLQRYKLETNGKIIDLRRFAYDYLVYSGKKFGLPDECICAFEIEENEYPHSDFISIFSRMLFRFQIVQRNTCYIEFNNHYELTSFSSFSDVTRALGVVISGEIFQKFIIINLKITTYLAVVSEMLLFLFSKNCNLYFKELSAYWADCVLYNSKMFVRNGGLADAYDRFATPEHSSSDVFFNNFIPQYCIPYGESSTLLSTFMREDALFMKCARFVIQQEALAENMAFLRDLTERDKTSERDEACATSVRLPSIPINTGLGIIPHEQLLSVLDVDTETSPQNIPITSGRETAGNRRLLNRKEKLKREPTLKTSEKTIEQSEANEALFAQHFPIGSYQKNTRDYKESTDKYGQSVAFRQYLIERKKSSGRVEASGTSIPMNTGLGIPPHEQWYQSESPQLDIDTETSLQNAPSTSSPETARNRRTSNRKEKLRRKPSSRTGEKPIEQSSTDVAGASAASFTENLPVGGCRRKTRDYNEPINKDNQKSSLLYNEDIERLKSSFVSSVKISPQSLPGTSGQEHLGDRKYPSSQKKD